MIAIEGFKKFRTVDYIAVAVLAIIWSLLSFVLSSLTDLLSRYILSLFLLIFISTFTVLLIKKAGAITLFYVISALITYNVGNIGPIGIYKLITFVSAGIIFELIFLLLKLEVRAIPLDIVVSASISAAAIPIVTGVILSFGVVVSMVTSFINVTLLSLFVGLASSVLLFIIWQTIKHSKFIVRLENKFY